MPRRILFLVVTFLYATVVLRAQTAQVSGTVKDTSNAVVPNAALTIVNENTGVRRTTTTNSDGVYSVAFLTPGPYRITVAAPGFQLVSRPGVKLEVEQLARIDFTLQVGPVDQTITVEGGAPLVNTTDGSVSTVVDRQFVANMPLNGRSLQPLLQLVPGVVLTTNDGGSTSGAQFSVNGQRTTSNYFTVDGISANTGIITTAFVASPVGQSGVGTGIGTTALGGTNSLVSLDALQEFRVETSTYAPEFGRTPGAQISLVTRGGTNQFHGSASEYFRNEALDANNWFANSGGQPRPRERQNFFGATFGGPIYFPSLSKYRPVVWSGKNRLFFFASYEGLRLEQPQAQQVVVPNASLRQQAPAALRPFVNALPLPNGQDFGNGTAQLSASYSNPGSFDIFGLRIDARVTSNLTTFFRFNHAPSESVNRTASLSTRRHTSTIQDTYTAGATWVGGTQLTADVRANWTTNSPRSYYDLDTFYGATVPDVADIFAFGYDPANSTFSLRAPGTSEWDWGVGNSDKQRQFNIVGTVAYVPGVHQFRFGVDYRRLTPLFGKTGGSFENIQFCDANGVRSSTACIDQITAAVPIPREAIIPELSLFGQDTWRVSSRLTLTYGVRFEHMPPPGEAAGNLPPVLLGISTNPPQNVRLAPAGTPLFHNRFGFFAPRFGAAYQLNRRSGWETALRAGVGQFFDLPFGNIASAFGFTWPYFLSVGSSNVVFPLNRIPPPVPGTNRPGSFNLLDPNIKLPYTIQWNAALEQGIGSAQKITATYVGARGRRLMGYRPVFPVSIPDFPLGALSNALLNIGQNLSHSTYDALQLQYTRHLSRGLQALASYTFGRSTDDLSNNTANPSPQSSANLFDNTVGPSDFDVRHVFSSGVSYDVPSFKRTRLLRVLTSGWGTDLLFRYQSSPPYNPVNIIARTFIQGTFFQPQLNLVPGVPIYVDDPMAPGGRRLNNAAYTVADNDRLTAAGCLWVARPPGDTTTPTGLAKGAFCTAPTGQQGNFPRNGLRAFAASQADFALRRQFAFNETVRLQIRAEFFNVLNHPNFGAVNPDIGNANFGRATSMLNAALGGLNPLYQMGGPRSGQLSVKVLF